MKYRNFKPHNSYRRLGFPTWVSPSQKTRVTRIMSVQKSRL